MTNQTTFTFDTTLKAATLKKYLTKIMKVDPNAVVCVRQCDGTDFPPFISLETSDFHKQEMNNYDFPNLLMEDE